MPLRYRCPHCKAILNPGTKVIFRVARGKRAALILLSPQVGNYNVILPEDFVLKEGEKTTFFCPVCREELTSPLNPLFNQVLRDRPEGGYDRVEFHRVFGKHATFVVTEDEVRAFGEDAPRYRNVNFFGAGRGEG
ncbi:MAG: hypothetical protein ACYTHM_03995 [Planctomycetota bacterium]|jgi:hypothetical protein